MKSVFACERDVALTSFDPVDYLLKWRERVVRGALHKTAEELSDEERLCIAWVAGVPVEMARFDVREWTPEFKETVRTTKAFGIVKDGEKFHVYVEP